MDLRDTALALRRAAVRRDLDAVHRELSELRSALVRHTHVEREAVWATACAVSEVTPGRQQQLLDLLNELLFTAERDDGSCACIVRAAEVELLLQRQAKLERLTPRANEPPTLGPARTRDTRWGDRQDDAERPADVNGLNARATWQALSSLRRSRGAGHE